METKTITTKTTINFGDNVWSISNVIKNVYPWALVGVESEAIFEGNEGGIDTYNFIDKTQFNANDCYSQAITIGRMGTTDISGKLTINGGKYMSPATCIYVACGTCIINNGIFFGQPGSDQKAASDKEKEKYGPYRNFTLNLYDSYGKSGKAAIYVNGGTFYGFDPADNYAEGNGTNFVTVDHSSYATGETYKYMVKDTNRSDNGTLVEVPVYKVVATADVPEDKKDIAIAGNKTIPTVE